MTARHSPAEAAIYGEPLHCCGTTTADHRSSCPTAAALKAMTSPIAGTTSTMLGEALDAIRAARGRLAQVHQRQPTGWTYEALRRVADAAEGVAEAKREADARETTCLCWHPATVHRIKVGSCNEVGCECNRFRVKTTSDSGDAREPKP